AFRAPPPFVARANPDHSALRYRQEGIAEDVQVSLCGSGSGTSLGCGCKLCDLRDQQIHALAAVLAHRRSSSISEAASMSSRAASSAELPVGSRFGASSTRSNPST